MKALCIYALLLIGFTQSLESQTDRGRVGLSQPNGYFPELSPTQQTAFDRNVKALCASNNVMRVVHGNVYNVVADEHWQYISGAVEFMNNGCLIVRERKDFLETGKHLILTNCPALSAKGLAQVVAMPVGIINDFGYPTELWDCGTPYIPPPPTPEQIARAQDAKVKNIIAQHQRSALAESNAVTWLQSQSTNGSPADQFSLAMHYLNGQGCATNRDLAIYWLQQSARAGSEEAARKLRQMDSIANH